MKKIHKTKDEILLELDEQRKENEALKTKYAEALSGRKNEKSEHEIFSLNSPTSFDTANNSITQNDEQNIRQLFDDYIRMYASRDDRLTTYFSENFSGFTGGGDFLVKNKEEWVAITRQDFAQIKDPINIEIKDVAIQALSDTIAATTGFFTIHLPNIDHDLSRRTARLVLIFRKEYTGWKISHSSISIPYGVTREGEVYPMQDLVDRNQYLEELVAERTIQLSEANDKLQKINEKLAKEIVEHEQAQEELQQSNQKWEAIISASPDGIGMMSLDGKLQLMSNKLAELFGYSIEQKEEYIGKSAIEFVDPSDRKLLIDNISKLIAGKSDQEITEYLAIRKDNSRFYIEVNSTVLHDSTGNPVSIMFAERDITERKRAELIIRQQYDQLKELNSAKDKFFSIIAHDLKSPFQSLLGSSELLAKEIESLSQDEVILFSRGLYDSLKNLYDLLENLLNWSMMQRNMIEYIPVNLNIKGIVDKVVEITSQSISKKNISVFNNVDEDAFVYADSLMINSVIQNLIVNAIKFTPNKGCITIASCLKGDLVQVSVHDTGVGIESEKSFRLFDFSTLFTTVGTAGEKGTGLGLPLCKEFIERNSGKIWVESELGKGSKFTFTLPKTIL